MQMHFHNKKIASIKYFIGSMLFLYNFLVLIVWISLEAKIILFVGQNLNAKQIYILELIKWITC